jgi:Fe-coproporphyrin III synthase
MIRVSRYIHRPRDFIDPEPFHHAGHDISPVDPARRPSPVVFWNITNQCNLSCKHCYSDSGPSKEAESDLSTTESEVLIDDLAGLHVPALLFTGGEPLVRDDFFELAGYASGKGLTTAVSTNGTLIDPDAVRSLIGSGITYAGISLDSASPGLHDRFRGVMGSHNRSVRALEYCVEGGLKCGIRMTLTNENYQEVDRLIDLGISIGVPRFCIYWLVPSGRGKEILDSKQLSFDQVRQVLDAIYTRARDTDPGIMEFLTVDSPQDALYFLHRIREDGLDADYALRMMEKTRAGCSAGNYVVNIDALGNVYPCQFARQNEFLMGNVRESRFSDLWSQGYHVSLDRFRNPGPGDMQACRSCEISHFCSGGCRVRSYECHADHKRGDPLSCIRKEEGLNPNENKPGDE